MTLQWSADILKIKFNYTYMWLIKSNKIKYSINNSKGIDGDMNICSDALTSDFSSIPWHSRWSWGCSWEYLVLWSLNHTWREKEELEKSGKAASHTSLWPRYEESSWGWLGEWSPQWLCLETWTLYGQRQEQISDHGNRLTQEQP